jgi:hypothetical protein
MRNMSHDMDVKNMPHVSLRSDTFILDLQLMVEFLFHLRQTPETQTPV